MRSLSSNSSVVVERESPDGRTARETWFERLVALSAGYYWEQNADFQLTFIQHRPGDPEAKSLTHCLLGRTPWGSGGTPLNTSWEAHRKALSEHRPFADLLVQSVESEGKSRYWRVTGEPIFIGGRFAGYYGIARDVTQEMRLRRLQRTVTSHLGRADHFCEALKPAIAAICESEGWEAGQYWTLDTQAGVMRVDVSWSIARECVAKIMTEAKSLALEPGAGLVGHVWKTGEALWAPSLAEDDRVLRKDIPERAGWNSALVFPVIASESVIGVLNFNAPYIPEPSEQLLQICDILGMQIGNIREQTLTLRELKASRELYGSTFELAAIGIAHVDVTGRFIEANGHLCAMLGYSRDELLGVTVEDISHPEDRWRTQESRRSLHSREIESFNVEKRYVRRDGSTIWVRLTVTLKCDDNGAPLYDVSVMEDITDRKRAEEKAEYLSTHDELTGLTNRATFGELLDHSLRSAGRGGGCGAVLFIDLDRFGIINDSLGHDAGDKVLVEIANRLVHCVRRADVVARFGGDEFVALLESVQGGEQAARVARKLLGAVLEPVRVDGQELRITASIGIVLFPEQASDAATVMKRADAAKCVAKEEGKNSYQFYAEHVGVRAFDRLNLESRLRKALARKEFYVEYQPRVDLTAGRVVGVEALLRWWNPELGSVSPMQFIPIAEEIGLIDSVGTWVLGTACRTNVKWQQQGRAPVVMAVNLSPQQFRNPRLAADVADVLEASGMSPDLLELEITETMLISNVKESLERITALKQLGVRFAIDDFGTGYSSLSQLKALPIDTLKVDRSFIRELQSSPRDQAITEAVIVMGRSLGVTIVAEGVETQSQVEFLRQRGCGQGQGYFFGPPSRPAAVASLLGDRSGHWSCAVG